MSYYNINDFVPFALDFGMSWVSWNEQITQVSISTTSLDQDI